MANVQPLRRSKPGPKVRACEPRLASTVRFLESHRNRFMDIATELGDVPLSDYVAYSMARSHGLDIPDYLQYIDDLIENHPNGQEELPLPMEA